MSRHKEHLRHQPSRVESVQLPVCLETRYTIPTTTLVATDNQPPHAIRFLQEITQPYQIHTVKDAATFLMEQVYHPWQAFSQEELMASVLNTKGYVTHNYLVYRGTVDSVPIRPAEIFRPALILNASNLIISHNHPSGDPEPSDFDVRVTELLVAAGQLLDIEVHDHLVIGKDRYVSLRERKLGFE